MAIYRQIYMSFWTDTKVDETFSPEDKYFYLYLMTNPHTNICGCYEIGYKQMARETGYNEETVKRLVDRMANVHRVIRYDAETREIFIVNWCKYNWTSSEKLLTSVQSVAKHIKNDNYRNYILEKVEKKLGETNTVSIPYTYPMDTSVSDSDSDSVSVPITVNKKNNNSFSLKEKNKKEKDEPQAAAEQQKPTSKIPSRSADPLAYYEYMANSNIRMHGSNDWFIEKARSEGIELTIIKDPETGTEKAQARYL